MILPGLDKQLLKTLTDVVDELRRAREKHPTGMRSAHEGWAVLYEEVDELWEEVRAQTGDRNHAKMRKEAIQVAAMALRFILEVCNPKLPAIHPEDPE